MTTSPVMGITEELLAELSGRGSSDTLCVKAAQHIRSLTERLEKAEKNAARYQHLERQGHFRAMSIDMGGNHSWTGIGRHIGKGPTIEEAIDAAIAQQPAPAAPVAQEPVARQDPENLDRICSARTMLEAKRTGGATLSALKPLTRRLYTTPPAAEQPDTVAVPRKLLAEAESIIESYAEALKASHAPGCDWDGEEAAHDEYEFEAGVASKLRALLAGGDK